MSFDQYGWSHTWGDSNGSVLDWSGVSGVSVCLTCNHHDGPFFNQADLKAGAAAHREEAHRYYKAGAHKPTSEVTPEAITASKTRVCIDCGGTARARGLCAKCTDVRVVAWLKLNGELDENQSLHAWRKDNRTYSSPRWAGYVPPEPKNATPKPEPVAKPAPKGRVFQTAKDPSTWVHGTVNTYQNYGCRCVPCRAASTAYFREARRRRVGRKIA